MRLVVLENPMNSMLKVAVLAVCLSAVGAPAVAAPIDAEALHQSQCMSCHGTEVYTRADRRVQSMEMLQAQINRCTLATRAGWNEEQKAAVVKYLNDKYYHFNQ